MSRKRSTARLLLDTSAVVHQLHGTILLIAAWPKSEREDLERDDYKAIGKTIARVQTQLDQRRNS